MRTLHWVFALSSLALGSIAILLDAELRLPGNHVGYAPEQPIAFSHRLHAGDLALDCLFCHSGAERSRHAGIPAASVCMKCHADVTAGWAATLQERELAREEEREPRVPVSPELAKLYAALGLGDDLEPLPDAEPRPLAWTRVHDMADFVFFDHSVHVARGVSCQTCHGPVQAMERIRQHSSFSMGTCIECHRNQSPAAAGPNAWRDHASTDCVTCHL
jgi:hypothetical protein